MQSTNVYFTGPNAVEVRREAVPPIGAGDALIAATCSLISAGTELICLERRFEPGSHFDRWVQYPFAPGYSHVGAIVQLGEGVEGVVVGQRVLSLGRHHQFACHKAARLFPIPDEVTDEAATWAVLGYVVQHGVRKAQIELGATVVVIGLGMLGQLAVQYAALCGATRVIAFDTIAARRAMAQEHGATHTPEVELRAAAPVIADLTRGRMADVVFDMTGHAGVFAAALPLLRKQGKLVLIGDTGSPSGQQLTADVITRDLQIIGAHGPNSPDAECAHNAWTKRTMVELFMELVATGRMRVGDLVTHRFNIADAPAAYELLRTDRAAALGVMLTY